ncbi:MAG: ABC transporter ATP-binding protein [Marmoricola sp.]
MTEILRAEALTLSYGSTEVLRGVSVVFPGPETVAITGPSGSGKTSLLYSLSGLERGARGSVRMLDTELTELSPDALSDLRLRNVGFVFQSSDLVPELTLRQNVALPLQLAGTPRREVATRVDELLDRLGLGSSADRRPGQVSGGQAQRCAVARAVVARPLVVFADEPTGALDQENREVVLGLLIDEVRALEGLLITVTHDPDVAARFERRISLLDGVIVDGHV